MKTLARFLVVLVLLPVYARGSVPATITLSGSANASVDVTLDEDLTTQIAPTTNPGAPPYRISTTGSYVGYAIQRLPDLAVLSGAVFAPRLDWEPSGQVVPLGGSFQLIAFPFARGRYGEVTSLPRGAYRLTLFTDGQASIDLPLTGATVSVTYHPTRPVNVDAETLDLDPLPGMPAVPVGDATRTITVGPSTFTVIAAAVQGDAQQAGMAGACVGPLPCVQFVFTSPGSVRSDTIDDHEFQPGDVAGPQATIRFDVGGAGYTTMRRGFWFTWDTTS